MSCELWLRIAISCSDLERLVHGDLARTLSEWLLGLRLLIAQVLVEVLVLSSQILTERGLCLEYILIGWSWVVVQCDGLRSWLLWYWSQLVHLSRLSLAWLRRLQ